MRELDKSIGRVFVRLRSQRFLSAFVWALAGWLMAAAAVLGVDKLYRPIPGPDWLPFAVAGGLAFATALLIAVFTGPSRVDAAVAIDHAFQLNERLSTTLTLPEDLRDTAAGKALIADTVKQVSGLDVADRFGLKLPKRAWAPLVPGAIAVVILFAPEWANKLASAKGLSTGSETKIDQKVVTKQSEQLKDRIAAQRKEMSKEKFAEAEKLLAEVEKAANDLAKSPPAEKDKALMALNKLTESVKERQKALGSPESINRQLQQMKEMNTTGPAGEFMKNLTQGKYDKAAKDLKSLQEKLLSGKMTEPEKKALKEQLGEMSKQLEKLANLDQRKEQLEQAKKNGGMTQEQFQKEMAKLDEQKKSLQNLQKLAEQLSKANGELNKGDMKKAADALGMSQQQMEEMAKQMQELQSLDSALADLQDAKDGMNGADQLNQFGDNLATGNKEGRNRMKGAGGRGQGQGDRPESEDDTAMYNSKVKSNITKGKAVFDGFAPPSKQMKGQSVISVQGEAETASGNAADALTNQKVPKSVEKHVKGYFDLLNKGQ